MLRVARSAKGPGDDDIRLAHRGLRDAEQGQRAESQLPAPFGPTSPAKGTRRDLQIDPGHRPLRTKLLRGPRTAMAGSPMSAPSTARQSLRLQRPPTVAEYRLIAAMTLAGR